MDLLSQLIIFIKPSLGLLLGEEGEGGTEGGILEAYNAWAQCLGALPLS